MHSPPASGLVSLNAASVLALSTTCNCPLAAHFARTASAIREASSSVTPVAFIGSRQTDCGAAGEAGDWANSGTQASIAPIQQGRNSRMDSSCEKRGASDNINVSGLASTLE